MYIGAVIGEHMGGASSWYCLPVSLSIGSFLIGPSYISADSSIDGDGYLWDACGYSPHHNSLQIALLLI